MAEKIGVNRAQISRLKSGETKSLHSDLLVKLEKVFGVSTDYLLCLTRQSNARYTDVDKLGLSEEAAKKFISGSIDADVFNRLLEHKSFAPPCDQIRIYYDDTYTEGYLCIFRRASRTWTEYRPFPDGVLAVT